MNDLQVPGLTPLGDGARRITGSRQSRDKDSRKHQYQQEHGEPGSEAGKPAVREEERPAARAPGEPGNPTPDPGDGTGQRINVTA